jgi:hypothetical protein
VTTYADEPVTIRLDDSDAAPVAVQSVGVLPVRGASLPPSKWMFKTRDDGVTKVLLKKSQGQLKIIVKARHWFSAAAADEPAASTHLTVNVGTQCFTHPVTMKVVD